jgi:hypothetical protein
MIVSKIKKNFKKRFISKKKQMGKGPYTGNLGKNRHVPVFPFPEKIINKIMKEVVETCNIKLYANYDKRSFIFYDPYRELMFEYLDKNMLIDKLIIKDDYYFTEIELSEIQTCIYLAVAKYKELDESAFDIDESDYEKTFNIMERVRINLKLCNYNNKNITNEVATVLDTYEDKNSNEWCILRFHNAGIGDDSEFGPNTAKIPVECLETYWELSRIQPVEGDYAVIDFNLKYCPYKSLNSNYNYASGKIVYKYVEKNIEMCIFKFDDLELGTDHPIFGPNTTEIPINCLNVKFMPLKSMETSPGASSAKSFRDVSAKDNAVFDDFTEDDTPTILKVGDVCTIKKCDYINKYYNYIGEIGTILYFFSHEDLGEMCGFRFHNKELGEYSGKFGPNIFEIPINCLDVLFMPSASDEHNDDEVVNYSSICGDMWSYDLQIGDRVISCDFAIYDRSVPKGSKGTVVSITERYGKSDIHRQFKVKFDKYPLGDVFTNLYYGDRLRRI